jgi:hypothetical protein
MPRIIRRLPFVEQDETLAVPGGKLIFLRNELIVWVSVIQTGFAFDSTVPCFPAALDTGCTHNLVMRPDQFANLAGYELSAFSPICAVPIRGRSTKAEDKDRKEDLPQAYDFNLFLYGNITGERNRRLDSPPLKIELDGGIVLTPTTWTFPPLPVLGMRAIREARLRLRIDSKQGLSVWSPRET